MQTFLPYDSFFLSAKCLDYRRLGKQRVEAAQLIRVVEAWEIDPSTKMAWINHPAAVMWRGYSDALRYYHDCMVSEWIDRGYKNTMPFLFRADKSKHYKSEIVIPPWLNDEDFHASHRSNLLRKDPEFYGKYGWTEPNDLPYVWPGN